MNNNDILRRIRYIFDFNDTQMISLFALSELPVTRTEVSAWLKPKDHPEEKELIDKELAHFLNGLIVDKRGQKEGEPIKTEKSLNNNQVLRKLKIALNLKIDDMVEILDLANLQVSKHELNAFFRKPEQNQYRVCKDQFLRNFLQGLQIKYRDKQSKPDKNASLKP